MDLSDAEKKYIRTVIENERARRQSEATKQERILRGVNPNVPPGLTSTIVGWGAGMRDVYDGFRQWALGQEDEVNQERSYFKELKADPEYGMYAQGGEVGGLLTEPLSTLIPIGKAKSAGQAMRQGMAIGAGFGAAGYAEDGEQRLLNTAIGTGAGAVLNPAIYAIGKRFGGPRYDTTIDADMPHRVPEANMTDAQLQDVLSRQTADVNTVVDQRVLAEQHEQAARMAARERLNTVPGADQQRAAMNSLNTRLSGPNYEQAAGLADKLGMGSLGRQFRERAINGIDGDPVLDSAEALRVMKAADADEAARILARSERARASAGNLLSKALERKGAPAALELDQIVKLPHKTIDEAGKALGLTFPKKATRQQKAEAIHNAGLKLYSNPLDPELFRDFTKWVNNGFWGSKYGGKYIYELARRNPGSAVGAVIGAANGDVLYDENAGVGEKILASVVTAAIGAGGVQAASRLASRASTRAGAPDVIELIKKEFIDNYGLPEDYVRMRKGMTAKRNHIAGRFDDVTSEIMNLPTSDRRLLYRMLTGEAAPRNELKPISKKARDLITEYAQVLVDAGWLKPETFKKNVDTYIHRSYAKHVAGKETAGLSRSTAARLDLSELRQRGVPMTVKNMAEAQKYLDNGQGWYVQKRLKDGRVSIRRDFTRAERDAMGEIDDAAFAIRETGRLLANDTSVLAFYKDVANKFAVDPQNIPAERLNEFAHIPAEKVRGTQVPRYGALEGKYVPKEIAEDIMQFQKLREAGENSLLYKAYDGMLRAWKVGKTALNPTVHMNNIVSNFGLYDLADAKWKHLWDAMRRFRPGVDHTKDDMIRLAKEYGVFSSDWVTKELGAVDAETRKLMEKISPKPESLWDNIAHYAKATWNRSGGKMIDAYHAEDNVFRLGVFMDRLEKGMSPEDAALDARKWLIDYDINARGVHLMRQTAMPFISYTYRAMPLLLEGFARNPTKAAKWMAVGYGLSAGASSIWGSGPMDHFSEKAQKERKMMDERYQGSFLGIPHMLRVGEDDAGTGQYLDVTRWIPGGDMFDARGASIGATIEGIPAALTPTFGGPIAVAKGVIDNHDAFTGKPIVTAQNDDNPFIEKMKWAGSQFMPNNPVIPGSYSQQTIVDAARGGETALGARLTVPQAVASTVGVKVRPADLDKLEMQARVSAKAEIRELRSALYRLKTDLDKKRLTPGEYEREREKLRKKAREVRDKLMEKIGD